MQAHASVICGIRSAQCYCIVHLVAVANITLLISLPPVEIPGSMGQALRLHRFTAAVFAGMIVSCGATALL